MKNKTRPLIFILILILIMSAGVFLLTACSEENSNKEPQTEEKTIDDFDGMRIGVLTGGIGGSYIEKRLPDAKISYFSDVSDAITAMKAGRLDGVCQDSTMNMYVAAIDPTMSYVAETLREYGTDYAVAFPKNEDGAKLRDLFNEFLRKYNNDNYFEKLTNAWLNQENPDYSLCDYESLTGTNGTLVAATSNLVPFTYVENGKEVGSDIAIATLFCKEYGYGLEVMNMDFGSMIASLGNKTDFTVGSISITEERAESVYFSDPYYQANLSILYKGNAETGESFTASLKNSFTRTFVNEDRWELFLQGIGTTMLITVLSLIFGTILGFLLFLLCYRGHRIFTTIADVLSRLLNALPVVVVLMIFYYLIFSKSTLSGTSVSVVVFTLVFTTSMYSMIKGGVKAIGDDQEEAAAAIGFTKMQGFFMIILPQAAAHFLPRYKEEVISLIKATAIVGYIAVQDLTKVSDIVRSRTYEAFFPLISTAVVYLILAELLILLVRIFSRRVDTRSRKTGSILKGVKTDD